MTKIIKQILSLTSACLVLSGCINNLDTEQQESNPNEIAVQTTNNQTSLGEYRAVITDGSYKLGASASMSTNLNSADNQTAFEEGLLRISKTVFPTDQYFLQEGQLINAETLSSWVARQSGSNSEGLNPTQETQQLGSTSDESTQESTVTQVSTGNANAPIYLAQIMEKDIMIETESGYSLGGIVIGLAMNSTYEYTDESGVKHTQEITIGEIRERAKAYANTIVGRLRNTEELRSIPILIGVFSQSPSNAVVGGSYLLDGISREGNSVTDWSEHNEARVLLPYTDSSNSQYQYFNDFKAAVVDFFPNLNGVTGEVLMIDGALSSLNIEIVTQFYSVSEVTALTQHVLDSANSKLPEGVELQIVINSAAGTEAFISRESGATNYSSHVFQ